jgi:fermentation-respiration switch protein FrsA (DUF1100 family)
VSDLRPADHIDALGAPLLLLAGSEDQHTTREDNQRLFAAARPPKELWNVEGAAHVDLHAFTRRAYEKRVGAFLERELRGGV